MPLVKTTFNSALNTQLSSVLKTAFDELFLDGLDALPDNVRSQSEAKAAEKATLWSSKLAEQLATAISDQVDTYIKSGTVTVTVAPGIAVTTAGTALAQTGATTAPGTGTGSVA